MKVYFEKDQGTYTEQRIEYPCGGRQQIEIDKETDIVTFERWLNKEPKVCEGCINCYIKSSCSHLKEFKSKI